MLDKSRWGIGADGIRSIPASWLIFSLSRARFQVDLREIGLIWWNLLEFNGVNISRRWVSTPADWIDSMIGLHPQLRRRIGNAAAAALIDAD